MYKNIEIFENEVKNLEKTDDIFIVSDFDDTIFCRKEQLENSEILRNNRWNKWNEVIKNVIWIDNFIEKFYKNKNFPNDITKNFSKKLTLILTAWYQDIQNAKLKATWLDIFPKKIVYESFEKPFEMVKYIVEELKFIPNEIHIYEDRPEHFLEKKQKIEDFLKTKIKIFFVEMIDNEKSPKIKELI